MEDVESPRSTVLTPLLPSNRFQFPSLAAGKDLIENHILTVHRDGSWIWKTRTTLQTFLSGKWGHYAVIGLVSLDVAGIFAGFLISLHICEHSREKRFNRRAWETAEEALDISTLVFSCLFMVELLLSVFAFGFSYFYSKFHVFDATVIVAGFIVDVLLHGAIEEAGSLVVIFRLWRVFKIIEEFGSAGEDKIEELQERIEDLERDIKASREDNENLRVRIKHSGGSEQEE